MIDIENAVFDRVATRIRAMFPGIFVTGEYTDAPASFPAVSILEADNKVYPIQSTTGKIENAVSVMYEIDIYSNKVGYRKQECQDILNEIDDEMSKIGFTRTMSSPLSNLIDATVFRQHARYKGIVKEEEELDEYGMTNEVYRIYTE